jgi:CRISPR/Cas system-associated protein Cas5 (RAMP superfamily)
MIVYACFEVYFDYCNQYDSLHKIVASEQDAKDWVAEFVPTKTEWRTEWRKYHQFQVKESVK